MPSSEDCIAAQNEVKQAAKQQLINEGHSAQSAEEILKWMPYNAQVEKAEKIMGPIYRGPYSSY